MDLPSTSSAYAYPNSEEFVAGRMLTNGASIEFEPHELTEMEVE